MRNKNAENATTNATARRQLSEAVPSVIAGRWAGSADHRERLYIDREGRVFEGMTRDHPACRFATRGAAAAWLRTFGFERRKDFDHLPQRPSRFAYARGM